MNLAIKVLALILSAWTASSQGICMYCKFHVKKWILISIFKTVHLHSDPVTLHVHNLVIK